MMRSEDQTEVLKRKKSKFNGDDDDSPVLVSGKENLLLKVYPKRNREQSLKGVLSCAQLKVNKEIRSSVELANKPACPASMLKPVVQVESGRNEGFDCGPVSETYASGAGSLAGSIADFFSNSVPITFSSKQLAPSSTSSTLTGSTEKDKGKALNPETKSSKTKSSTSQKSKPKTPTSDAEPQKKKRCMPKTVDKLLEKMNIKASKVSCCLKSAMSKGIYKITGDPSDLEQVVIEDEYEGHTFKVLVKDVLYQPDYAGLDYEDGAVNAPAMCVCSDPDSEDYCGDYCHAYVTRICTGMPQLDSGKFHNHCTECKGFGKCIGDYREAHCSRCDKHWFAGNLGFPCDNCERQRDRGGMIGVWGDDCRSSDEMEGREDCSLM